MTKYVLWQDSASREGGGLPGLNAAEMPKSPVFTLHFCRILFFFLSLATAEATLGRPRLLVCSHRAWPGPSPTTALLNPRDVSAMKPQSRLMLLDDFRFSAFVVVFLVFIFVVL